VRFSAPEVTGGVRIGVRGVRGGRGEAPASGPSPAAGENPEDAAAIRHLPEFNRLKLGREPQLGCLIPLLLWHIQMRGPENTLERNSKGRRDVDFQKTTPDPAAMS
jgi:hypothetical protein